MASYFKVALEIKSEESEWIEDIKELLIEVAQEAGWEMSGSIILIEYGKEVDIDYFELPRGDI